MDGKVIRDVSESIRKTGQCRRLALQLADQRLSWKTLDEILERRDLQPVVGGSEEKKGADGKSRTNHGI